MHGPDYGQLQLHVCPAGHRYIVAFLNEAEETRLETDYKRFNKKK